MKKLFFLLIPVLLTFSVFTTYAQFVPREIECLDLNNPLMPVAGNAYTYSVEIPTPPGVNSFRWFVTQDQNFIQGGVLTTNYTPEGGSILYSAEAHYTNLIEGENSIELVWQSWVYNPAEPVFVVVEVRNNGVGGSGCGTMNLKAYKIQPQHAFTLDIANVNQAGDVQDLYGQDDLEQCVSDIASAIYDFDNDRINYDFGEDTLFFAVIAANWTARWQLSVQFLGLLENQTADIYWGYTHGATTNIISNDVPAPGIDATSNDLIQAQDPPLGTIGADGEIIHIMVVVKHNNFQSTEGQQFTLAVNGQLHDGTNPIANMYDVHHQAGPGGECPHMEDYDDLAMQTIMPRPTVTPSAGAPDFLPITD
jgi:hypothetical protein